MVRIDTFVDQTRIKRIKTVIAEMLAELGFPNAAITAELQPLARRAETRASHVHHQRRPANAHPANRVRRQRRIHRRKAGLGDDA